VSVWHRPATHHLKPHANKLQTQHALKTKPECDSLVFWSPRSACQSKSKALLPPFHFSGANNAVRRTESVKARKPVGWPVTLLQLPVATRSVGRLKTIVRALNRFRSDFAIIRGSGRTCFSHSVVNGRALPTFLYPLPLKAFEACACFSAERKMHLAVLGFESGGHVNKPLIAIACRVAWQSLLFRSTVKGFCRILRLTARKTWKSSLSSQLLTLTH